MRREEIPNDVIISTTPAGLREIVKCLSEAAPILVDQSGDFPAYTVDADRLDRARELAKQMLGDFERINKRKPR